jgi:hypothetical protein
VPQGPPASSDLDLFTPLALSSHELLLAGTESGKPDYDVFLYDLASKKLENLTDTPALDEGGLCVQPERRLVAFRAGREQRFARVADGLEPLEHERVPGFQSCLFLDETWLLGDRPSTTSSSSRARQWTRPASSPDGAVTGSAAPGSSRGKPISSRPLP